MQGQGNHADVFAQRLGFSDEHDHQACDEAASLWGIVENVELTNAVVANDGTSVWAVYVGDDDQPRLLGKVDADNGVGTRWKSWQAARRLMVEQEIR